jgi:hypothetical protein
LKVIPPEAWPRNANACVGKKLRGPATIGELLRCGQGLSATCAVCLHSGRLDAAHLLQLFGDDHACSEAALRDRLQCSVCGSRDVVVRETGPSGDSDCVPMAKIEILAEV